MALENSNDMVMPVSPMNGGYGNGTFGNDGWWIILLFILLGRGGYGYGGSGMGIEVQSGFNQAALQNGLTDIQQSICNGFAGAEASASARQMAAMNQAFAAQTAVTGAQGRGPGAARDSMGRYSAGNDMMSELNSLAMSMPDEQSRQAIQSIMNKYR